MRIIKRVTVETYWKRHPQAEHALLFWHRMVKRARWTCIQDVRTMFPHADAVAVASGNSAVVFNIAGNKYRLITAIHYNAHKVFVLKFLTHAEYDKGKWKDVL